MTEERRVVKGNTAVTFHYAAATPFPYRLTHPWVDVALGNLHGNLPSAET